MKSKIVIFLKKIHIKINYKMKLKKIVVRLQLSAIKKMN